MLIFLPVLGSLQLVCHLCVSCKQIGFARSRLYGDFTGEVVGSG